MDDYITKPITPETLKTTLQRWISSSETASGPPETAASASPPAAPVIDEEEVLELLGGDRSLLAELARIFLAESPKTLAAIRSGVANNDAPAVHFAAHSLKGSVGNFSAKTVFEAARVLEDMGRQDNLSGAVAAVATLEQELARLQPILAAFAAQVSPT